MARSVSEGPRIGVFGGTFDPIHNAHCAIARTAMAHARLDRILFVVAGLPPHKQDEAPASAEDRYAMVCAAVAGVPGMEASRLELDRPGPSYTVDTLRAVEALHPGAKLFLVVGHDSLIHLPEWYDMPGILSRAHLLAVPRPGLPAPVPPELDGHYDMLPFAETTLSSTEVRDAIISGQPYAHLVPPAVARLIAERGVYHAV